MFGFVSSVLKKVFSQPQDTLPRVNEPDVPTQTHTDVLPNSTNDRFVPFKLGGKLPKVDSGIYPKSTPDVPTQTHTDVLPNSTNYRFVPFNKLGGKLPPSESPKLASSSSFAFGAIPGSPKSPSVSNYKPILARAGLSNPTSNETKSQYNVVEKGSTPLHVIPEDIKDLVRKDIVPGVLRKPLSPQTYKDYFATMLYAEDYYLEIYIIGAFGFLSSSIQVALGGFES